MKLPIKKSKKTTKKVSAKKAKKQSVDLDKLAKDNETTANATDYQAYLRNRMKGVKLA